MRRFIALALGITALAVTPVPTANAAHDTCDGVKTQITGTGKAETFNINPQKRVINTHGGNDVIIGDLHPVDLAPATVCMGSGDDVLRPADGPDAVSVKYLNGGKGFDTAEIYACFEGDSSKSVEVVSIEKLIIVHCEE